MGNIGDSISDSAPAVSTAGPGYATTINALLTELKARLVAKIPLSSLLTNANFDLNGQALLNAGYITMVNEGVSPVASPSNRLAAYAGDLWWVSPSGALQISDGATLNAGGIGGITGDYSGAGPMEFRYDTANTRYDAFANQSTNTWAYVRARAFDVAGSATSAFRARIAFGGTANATYTLPSAVPAATKVLQMNTSGDIIHTSAITLPTDESLTLVGDAVIKHDSEGQCVPLGGTVASSGTVAPGAASDAVYYRFSSGGTFYIPINLNYRERIRSFMLRGTSTQEPTVTLYRKSNNTATLMPTTTGFTLVSDGVIESTVTSPLQTGQHTYWVKVVAGAAFADIFELELFVDRT